MTDRRRLVTALGLGAGLGFVGMPPLRAAETSDEEPWDVLFVGSGAAGLSAALAAYEAGAQRIAILEKMAIAGGHTLSDKEPKFGLAVTGFAVKDKVWSNKGAKPGDSVILTKKLGVGLLMTAHKAGESDANEAIIQMRKLNKYAKQAAEGLSVHAATDVTGFSLMGHSYEAAAASGVSIIIDSKLLRFLPGAEEAARFGFVPEGRYTNEDYLEDKVQLPDGIPLHLRDMLFSPETSGGLLLFMSPEDAEEYLKRCSDAFIIGRVAEQQEKPVIVI